MTVYNDTNGPLHEQEQDGRDLDVWPQMQGSLDSRWVLQGQLELEHILLTAWKTVVEKKYSCNDLFLFLEILLLSGIQMASWNTDNT